MTDSSTPPTRRRTSRFSIPRAFRNARPVPETRSASAEYGAGPISKLFFAWCFPIIHVACLRRLELGDFPLLNPKRTSKELAIRFEGHLTHFKRAGKRRPLLRAIEATCRRQLFLGCCLQVASILIDYTTVVPFYFLYRYLQQCIAADKAGDPIPSFGRGVAYIAAIVAAVGLNNMLYFHGRYQTNMVGAEIRSACIGLVSKKACTIDPAATLDDDLLLPSHPTTDHENVVRAGDTSTVFTLCNVHVERVSVLTSDLVTCLRSLLNFPCLAGFLGWFIGWRSAVVIAIVVVLQSVALTALLKAYRQRRIADQVTDDRVAQLESIFSGMRLIKYFGWENLFLKRILAVREREIEANICLTLWNSTYLGTWLWCVTFAPVVAYALYAKDHSLVENPSIVLSAVTILVLDRNIGRFTRAMSGVLNAWPAARRLEEMLTKDDSVSTLTDIVRPQSGETIELRSAHFTWSPLSRSPSSASEAGISIDTEKQMAVGGEVPQTDTTFDLAPLNLTFSPGSLVAIVGPTQAGKSSLLSGITREMPLSAGFVETDGIPAYCPQKAWIQSATVKENIVFGQPFNVSIYERVLDSCALRPDLESFPRGDMSELGERGINLSGGQQHRLHLARTFYQALVDDRNIILLDDPLSAVDAVVSSVIFDNGISANGILAGRCRLLATHQLQYLSRCDRIIYMRDGRVLADGTFTELMNLPTFADFVGEYTQSEVAKYDLGSDDSVIKSHLEPAVDVVQETADADADADARVVMDEERASYKVPAKFYITALGNARERAEFIVATTVLVLSQMGFILVSLQTAWWTSDRWHLSLVGNAMLYFLFTIVHALTWGPYCYLMQKFWIKRSITFSSAALRGVMQAPLSFFNANPMGRLINRFTSDISSLDTTFPVGYWFFSLICIYSIAMVCVMLVYLPIVAALLAPWTGMGVLIFRIYKSTPLEIKRLSANMQSSYLTLLHEGLDGRTTIALAKHEDAFRDGIYKLLDEHNSVHFINFATFEWASICHTVTYIILMFSSGLLLLHTRLDHSPSTQVIVFAMLAVLASLLAIALEQGTNCQKGINAMERLSHFANELPSEGARSSAKIPGWPNNGAVTFDRVSLRYKPSLPMVLSDVTFDAAAGEKLGIVGRTGAGKSSLLMALLRLYDLSSGRITIDGQDITQLGLHDVRHAIATIPQDPVMFIGSVRFNLDPTGEISDDRLLQALERVHLIGDRAEGKSGSLTLDSFVTEGGKNFSSGQRQLLSLARALAKGSKIIVMDEPSSNVDSKMDALVQQTIREAFADCTVMMIAHRLRSVLRYDRVVVMDKGAVVEVGPPRDLFCQEGGGYFRALCEQASIELTEFPSLRSP